MSTFVYPPTVTAVGAVDSVNGQTGVVTLTATDVGAASVDLSNLVAPVVNVDIDMGAHKLKNLATPTLAKDAVTKEYVDNSMTAVVSVNGQTGTVVLNAASVGAANTALSNLITTAINQDLIGSTGATWNIQTADVSGASAKALQVKGGASDSGVGGAVSLLAGASVSGNGAAALVQAGDTVSGFGGLATLKAGNGADGSRGGYAQVLAGNASDGDADGGSVVLNIGTKSGAGNDGVIQTNAFGSGGVITSDGTKLVAITTLGSGSFLTVDAKTVTVSGGIIISIV